MTRLAWTAVLLALSAAASAAENVEAPKPVKPTPAQAVAAVVALKPPTGWAAEEYANNGGADPVVAFADGVDRIAVRVFGGPGTGYKKPAAFLASPAASTMGRKPEKIGSVKVAGRELDLFRHEVPVNLGDPHAASAPPTLGREIFCLLPAAGGRFVVLSYARESPAPDLEGGGEKAWEAFLKTVKLAGRKT